MRKNYKLLLAHKLINMTCRTLALSVILMTVFTRSLAAQTQLGSTIEDTDSLARIGWNLDLSANGLRLLAGAPNASEAHWLGGKVSVFDFVDGDWMQVGQDLLGTNEGDYFGTSLAMSADGSRFVVAVRNTNNMELPRTIVAYELQGEQWDTIGQVITTDINGSYTRTGAQMSADGNRIAAFIEALDNDMEEEEAVGVYAWQGDEWAPLGQPILPPQGITFTGVMALSADGQTVAVSGVSTSGFRRFLVYRLTDEEWTLIGQPVTSSESSDLFAWSISLSNDGQRIAVGAPRANTNGADSGNVTIYDLTDGQWVQVANNIPGENLLDQTGFSVSLSGDGQRLAVGDHYYDEPEFNSGRMRVFQLVENEWIQIGEETIGEDRADFYGQKVAISQDGSTVAAGAPQGGSGNDTPGQIKVFRDYPWVPILSVEELVGKVQVYPNPVNDYFFVDVPLNSRWQIVDVLGKPVRHGQTQAAPIDLSALDPGIYILQLQIDRNLVTAKIIKQ